MSRIPHRTKLILISGDKHQAHSATAETSSAFTEEFPLDNDTHERSQLEEHVRELTGFVASPGRPTRTQPSHEVSATRAPCPDDRLKGALSHQHDVEWLQNRVKSLEASVQQYQEEDEQFRYLYDGMVKENVALEERCAALASERDFFAAKYSELLSERFNAQLPGLWVTQAKLKSAFTDLCHHVSAWCDDAAYQAVKMQVGNNQGENLAELLALSRAFSVPLSRKGLAAVLMSRIHHEIMLRVFPIPDDSGGKDPNDLWASQQDAEWLRVVLRDLVSQGIPPDEVRRWKCLTTTAIAPHSFETSKRSRHFARSLWRHVISMVKGDTSALESQLFTRLEVEIVVKAVEISRLMRKCQSSVQVRWPVKLKSTSCRAIEDGTLVCEVLTSPELVTVSAGGSTAGAEENVLVPHSMFRIEGITANDSNGAGKTLKN
ncbi:hypothetical protein Z517_00548 [Fonsecaea pedrosoi CBS 271.37]|uniref:Uncharacterized protein n=1 Tax=Fonsecaea pedrosoi CBS 271.37 TaxID=1442368 RepID=A0A0D2GVZ8_9EURO|nr:uncharacterized protein Z517_00548 [Fonsecaea pedrosoi CBS 271.37]KIW85158.1 hypothetical protein Z517_00548 [Fonsecaea pedrosoi CBS 271.37]